MAIVAQEKKFLGSWQEAEAFARRITDRMQCPIGEGILETVVAFNLLGLPTCQSCEGHLNNGLPYPWVDFETNEFPAFKQALEEASYEGLSQKSANQLSRARTEMQAFTSFLKHLWQIGVQDGCGADYTLRNDGC